MRRSDEAAGASALLDVSLAIEKGSFVQVCGDASSGRRLLFDLLGWLETPESGDLFFGTVSSKTLAPEERGDQRNQFFGFLFEAPYLIPAFSVVENVAMPLFKVSGSNARDARCRTEELLDFVGMAQHLDAIGLHLSTEAQFRCALARALVNLPQVLFVEEPGGTAGSHERSILWELAHDAIEHFGVTVVWTGAKPFVPGVDRILELRDGVIAADSAQVESRADAP